MDRSLGKIIENQTAEGVGCKCDLSFSKGLDSSAVFNDIGGGAAHDRQESAGIDGDAVHRSAFNGDSSRGIECGAAHRTAADLQYAVLDRDIDRRRRGMDRGLGKIIENQTADGVGYEGCGRGGIIIIQIDISAVFNDIDGGSAVDPQLTAGIDRGAVRHTAGIHPQITAGIDGVVVRHTAGTHIQISAGIDGGPVHQSACTHIQTAVESHLGIQHDHAGTHVETGSAHDHAADHFADADCQIQRTLGDRQRIGVTAVAQRIAVDGDGAVFRIGSAERDRSCKRSGIRGIRGEGIHAFRLSRVHGDRHYRPVARS